MSTVKRIVFMVAIVALSLVGIAQVRAADQDLNHSAVYQDSGNAWLGVRVRTEDEGVVVMDVVSDSPADEAGLQHGDIITAVNGSAIASSEELIAAIETFQVGDEITLSVLTGDASRDVSVTLVERPADFAPPTAPMIQNMGMLTMLGVSATITDDGVTIDSIDPDSPFASTDLQAGDVITAVNGDAISDLNPRDLMQQLQDIDTVTLTVQRGGSDVEVTLDLAALRDQIGTLPMMPGLQGQHGMQGQQGNMMPGMQGGMIFGNGYLGIAFLPVTADLAAEQNLTVETGALVEEVVEGSPAAEAGLQVGDVITAVNGEAVDEEHTLRDRLIAYEPDDVVTLTVQRGAESLDLEATLAEQPGGMMQGMPGGFFWMPDQGSFEVQPSEPQQVEPATPSTSGTGPSA